MKHISLVVVAGLICLAPSMASAERGGNRTRMVATNTGRASGPTAAFTAAERKAKKLETDKKKTGASGAVSGAAGFTPRSHTQVELSQVAVDHEKKLTSARKWSDITAQLKGVMPGNVVAEFDGFAKGLPFPRVKTDKDGMYLKIDGGPRVNISYKADGLISVNGMDWQLRPLATTQEEVARLAKFLAGEKVAGASSWIDSLILKAWADDEDEADEDYMGAAAVTLAGGNAWKADACDEEDLSSNLNHDCPQMAVKMKPILATSGGKIPENTFLPVNLKCPAENNGTLELISKDSSGNAERLRIVYKQNKPVMTVIHGAEKNSNFEEVLKIDLVNNSDSMKVMMGKSVASRGDGILKEVCLGSANAKKRYMASLQANRLDRRSAQLEEESNEVNSLDSI